MGLPSTSTAPASAGVAGLLGVAGFMLLVYLRRVLGTSWEPVEN